MDINKMDINKRHIQCANMTKCIYIRQKEVQFHSQWSRWLLCSKHFYHHIPVNKITTWKSIIFICIDYIGILEMRNKRTLN